jgi:hypothetical protein
MIGGDFAVRVYALSIAPPSARPLLRGKAASGVWIVEKWGGYGAHKYARIMRARGGSGRLSTAPKLRA